MSTYPGGSIIPKRKRNHAYDIEYRIRNRDILRKKAKEYSLMNKDKIASYQKAYKQRPESRANRALWMQKQKGKATSCYLAHIFRARVTKILRYRTSKEIGFSRTKELRFIDFDALKHKLESQFINGWSWENWGDKWHIDHIWPCRIFDLSKREHIRACFSIDNMRAISFTENLSKAGSIPRGIKFPFNIIPILASGEFLCHGQEYKEEVAA